MANHRAVAHAWAHQTGRQQRGCNMFYEGTTLYSYRHSYPIGCIAETALCGRVALIRADRYSVSTAKHINYAHSAAGHMRTFTVGDVTALSQGQHAANHERMVMEACELVGKAKRARKYGDMLLSAARDRLDMANGYNSVFQLGLPVVSLENRGVQVADLEASIATARAAERERKRLADIKLKQTYHDATYYGIRLNADQVE
jgi:hypothetical protein